MSKPVFAIYQSVIGAYVANHRGWRRSAYTNKPDAIRTWPSPEEAAEWLLDKKREKVVRINAR